MERAHLEVSTPLGCSQHTMPVFGGRWFACWCTAVTRLSVTASGEDTNTAHSKGPPLSPTPLDELSQS